MSEYLSKKAVLEWLDDRRYKSPWIESFRDRLESGAFDAPGMEHINAYWAREGLIKHQEAELQRLRAALMDTSLLIEDMAVSRIDDFYRLRDNARAMVAMIHSVLSTLCDVLEADRDDELYGDWTDERCPKCGANLLGNKVGDKWCSMAGCDYGLRETDSFVTKR